MGETRKSHKAAKDQTLSCSKCCKEACQPYVKRKQGNKKSKEMIEQVINRRNMHLAYRQVVRNKGSAGVDGMRVNELKQHIDKDREAIVLSIIDGIYLPQPILGVSIPKGNGKTRLLGIPTVTDRWLQQVLHKPSHHYSSMILRNTATVSGPTKEHINAYNNHSSTSTKVISILLISTSKVSSMK